MPGGIKCKLACGDGALDNGPDNRPFTYAYNEVCDEGINRDPVACINTCTTID